MATAVLVLLAGGPATAQEEAPAARAHASKPEVTVGERFTVEVEAKGPEGTTFAFQAEIEGEGALLRTPAPGPSPLPPDRHVYEATLFALDEGTVPEIPVRYRLRNGVEGEVATRPVTVKMASLLPKEPKEHKLADIRGPVAVDVGLAFWIALGALAVLLLGIAFWLWKRRRPRAAAAPARAAAAPDQEALTALDALSRSPHLARGDFRAFYIELAVIVKTYLERRLGAPVLEMTTTETVAFLRSHMFAQELAPRVRDLVSAADAVKFAKGAALAEDARGHLAAARGLVTDLEARLRPEPPTEEKAA